jgi:hypothetical protein
MYSRIGRQKKSAPTTPTSEHNHLSGKAGAQLRVVWAPLFQKPTLQVSSGLVDKGTTNQAHHSSRSLSLSWDSESE